MMKKTFIFTVLFVMLFSACDRDYKMEIFPDEYKSVLYIKDNETRTLYFSSTQEKAVEVVRIIKAGAVPESLSSAELVMMDFENAVDTWGLDELSTRMIPEDCWCFDSNADFSFSSEENHKTVNLLFYPEKIKSYMNQNSGKDWILPVMLKSDDTTVNRDRGSLLIKVNVMTPFVSMTDNLPETVQITFKETEFNLGTEVKYSENNALAFSVELSSDRELVEEYNLINGTEYKPLPESAFSIGRPAFIAGQLVSDVKVYLKRDGLVSDEEYLMPLRIKALTTDKIEYSDDIKYVKVTNPKYCYEECDRSTWKIAFTNSEDRNSTYWAKNMLDGDINTNWSTYWNASNQTPVSADSDDFRYPDPGTEYPNGTITYASGRLSGTKITVPYPCCDGVRKYDRVAVVIDMQEQINLYGLGVAKKSGDLGFLDMKDVDVYIENSFYFETASMYAQNTPEYKEAISNYESLSKGNEWRKVMEWRDIPKGTKEIGLPPVYEMIDKSMIGKSEAKGRYILLRFISSYRETQNPMEVAELYVRKLVSVDGECLSELENGGSGEDWTVTELDEKDFNN